MKHVRDKKHLIEEIISVLVMYAKTQLVVVAIIALITWVMLWLIGVKYAVILAVLTGALASVPIFGMTVAAILSSVVAIFDGRIVSSGIPAWGEGIIVVLLYFLLNQFSDFFLTPYLMSKTQNIHPVLVFFSIIIGTSMFGIVGAFFAVPVLLVIRTVSEYSAKSSG